MNITLEEQILFISEEAIFARACVGNSSSKVWERRTILYKAILATLEACRDDTQDAKRYRFLKSKMTVPNAMQSFIRHNNWHPECMHLGFEETIDASMAMQTKA